MSFPGVETDLRRIEVVAPSLHRRFSGVTATIAALVSLQARKLAIAVLGPNLPAHLPHVSFLSLLRHGWTPPPHRSARIWHARRNNDMLVGLFLRDVLRQPWRLVFTSAAQRRHSALTRFLLRRMDGVVATSPYAAQYLDVPAMIVEHGVDTLRFSPALDRARAWAESGLPGRRGIGVFGRLRANKGTDLFVEAMLRLLPRYGDVTAVLIGLEAPEEAAFISHLKRRVSAAGLKERIVFSGERPADEVPQWFARVSVYVAPMRHEGFGLTPLEAMASGTAVVATRTGAAPRLVEDGVTGYLVPADDLEALIAAIEPLLAQPHLAEKMGAEGRRKALAQHDITREVERLDTVYATVWREEKLPDDRI